MRLDKIHGDWSSRIAIALCNLGILHRIDNFMTKSVPLCIEFLIWDVTKVGTIPWKIGFPIKQQSTDRGRSLPPLMLFAREHALIYMGLPLHSTACSPFPEERRVSEIRRMVSITEQFPSNEVPRKRSFDLARGSREEVGASLQQF